MTYKAQNFGVVLAVVTYKAQNFGVVGHLSESLLTIIVIANDSKLSTRAPEHFDNKLKIKNNEIDNQIIK